MKNRLFSLLLLCGFFATVSCDEANTILDNSLSDEEIAAALKEALVVGTDTSTAQLSQEDGYYQDLAVKILLPTEIRASIATFRSKSINLGLATVTGEQIFNGYSNPALGINIPGLKDKQEDILRGINRAAENAAGTAAPIFVNAITDITIADANDILFGGVDTAATFYLKQNTSAQLFTEYEPQIDAALQAVQIGNLTVVDAYEGFVADYNAVLNTNVGIGTVGSLTGVNTVAAADLSVYATNKGLDGLFLKIGDEEKQIRENPLARVTDLLEKVFGRLD